MNDEKIIAIRDEFLPNQGEQFDCIAFGRAIEKAVREECAAVAEGWDSDDGMYRTDGNSHFWDAGSVYDQGRVDVADKLRGSLTP